MGSNLYGLLTLRPNKSHKTANNTTYTPKMYDPRTIKDKTTPKVGKSDQSPTVFPLSTTKPRPTWYRRDK